MIPDPVHRLQAAMQEAPVGERADAARNRLRALDAARALFSRQGVEAVTMEQIATAAGVGRMTLYRRFGDKTGLAQAVLGEHERVLQEAVLNGPPPLGPGAEPAARLVAFARAYLTLVIDNLDLIRLSENGDARGRYLRGVYRFWHTHCQFLLRQAGVPHADQRADVLLAALTGELVHHRLHDRGDTPHTLESALTDTAQALASPATGSQ